MGSHSLFSLASGSSSFLMSRLLSCSFSHSRRAFFCTSLANIPSHGSFVACSSSSASFLFSASLCSHVHIAHNARYAVRRMGGCLRGRALLKDGEGKGDDADEDDAMKTLDVDMLRISMPLIQHLSRLQANVEMSFLLFQV